MTAKRALVIAAAAVVVALVGVAAAYSVSQWRLRRAQRAVVAPVSAPVAAGRKIKARLFYVAADGARLAGAERDVAYGEGVVEQARQIVLAQIAPVQEPLVSAVPAGTTLRALYVAERGTAFVDLSREVAAAHTGGSLDEILTVYSLVDALTANLPAITSVQLLIDGKQAETLSGHVDLRQPLAKNLDWVE